MADIRAIIAPVRTANTPSIASAATAISATTGGQRGGWSIQNLGTNVLFVRLGSGATTSIFHYALRAGTGNDDGTGGIVSQMEGIVYQGEISIAGTSPRYTVTELTP